MSHEAGWHRLSPWAVVAFSANGLLDAAKLGLYVLPVAFTGALAKLPDFWLPLAIGLMALHILISSALQWLRFRFQFDEQQQRFRIRSGALFRKKQELPLTRIQNVRLEQPLPMRLIGKVNLVVETAGSGEKEAVLCAVDPKSAARLKARLVPTASEPQQAASADEPVPSTNLTRQPRHLFLHGFCFNQLAWLMLFLGPLFSQLDQYPWWEWLEAHPVTAQWTASVANLGPAMLVPGALMLLTLLYLLLSVLSGVVSLLKYHPYRLTLEPERLQFSGGTLHRMQDLLLKRRIQSLSLSQSPLARLVGLWAISLKQVSGSEPGERLRGSLIVPAVRAEERHALVQDSVGKVPVPQQWRSISPFWRNLRLAWLLGLSLTLSLLVASLPFGPEHGGLVLLLMGLVIMAAIELKWRHYGFQLQADGLWLRQGMLGQQWHYLPLAKCQSLTLTQTPGLRKRGLTNLTLFLASGKQTLPAIPLALAQDLAGRILERIRQDQKNWL
ncbi:PH domain-containing protein [Ferrimonas futtsuensis]|uniref:PH domain-containing protein n=1 Tax=Ferrimonas futtsuensis TaxID=364764 RepID=UPI0003F4F028|nr:PH domain-containing protein [Ferrimonas futtsuensis]